MSGRLFVGTSGFAYTEWRPEFYPQDLKNDGMLSYYAERLLSVEINYTFYREPSAKTVAQWVERTPEQFNFALKANRKITHTARLADVDEVLDRFLRSASQLGPRLGPILFQLPPTLKYRAELLDGFLARLPAGDMPGAGLYRFAMEFRNATWDCNEVRDKLTANNVSWCVADTDEQDAMMVRTAPQFAYFRLRKLSYDDETLAKWSKEVASLLRDGADAYVYFKHEDTASGVMYAFRFRELVAAA
ncbi:MAG: DUF72 domain-containing protein [Actinomycetota bacterium]